MAITPPVVSPAAMRARRAAAVEAARPLAIVLGLEREKGGVSTGRKESRDERGSRSQAKFVIREKASSQTIFFFKLVHSRFFLRGAFQLVWKARSYTSSSACAPWVPDGKPSSRYDERRCRRERQEGRRRRWGGGERFLGVGVDNKHRPPSATAASAPARAWALFHEFLSRSEAHAHALEVGWSSENERRELKEGKRESSRKRKKLALFPLQLSLLERNER